MGSASELDYHLLLSRELGFMTGDDFASASATLTEVRKMLTSFLQSVEEQIEVQSRRQGNRERSQDDRNRQTLAQVIMHSYNARSRYSRSPHAKY
jgi:hypothetical protein